MVRAARWLMNTFGLPGAGLIFMLEGLGAPLPVEVPLWIVGSRQASGENTYWQMVLLMWVSTVIGNTVGYLAGYYGGRPLILKLIQWFRVKPEFWAKVEHWFHRHGLKLVVLTRWTNWGFAQNMWLSGISRVEFRRFFLVMTVNDFIWAMAWTLLSREAVHFFKRHSIGFLHMSTVKIGLIALAVGAVGVGGWYVWRWWKRRRQQPPAEEQNR
jgi:membrane protein DedA with SNARE-associated domain